MKFNFDGTHVMVDLETLGNGSNSVIIAIGAVAFTKDSVLTSFYRVVDPESCIKVGMKMDTSTLLWWLKQSQAAREAVCQPGAPLGDSLHDLFKWYPQGAALWGNGATFDNVILANAYKAVGLRQPWKYTADRCYRTMKNLFPVEGPPLEGTAHNALDDAMYQAKHLMSIFASIEANGKEA